MKEFKIFLNRFRKKSSRFDLKLFHLYCKGDCSTREEIINKLYEKGSKVDAYHGTRRRLVKHLVEFIPLQLNSRAAESERSIENLLMVANFLFEKHREEAAWFFLKQAEETARKTENYNLLNTIYSMQIDHYQSDLGGDLKEIIRRKEEYQRLSVEDDNANIAYQLIRLQLEKCILEGKEINLDDIVQKVLKDYNLNEAVLERPKLIYNVIAMTRSAVLTKKAFYSFEPYIEQKYKQVEKKGHFNEFNHYYKVNMLYMLAHVKYRNKKFDEAIEYLESLYDNLILFNKSQYFRMIPRYTLLLAAVKNFSGKNHEAIALLENLLQDKKIRMDNSAMLNTHINLSTYYFLREEYKKTVRLIQKIGRSDAWLEKAMGKEWVLKKNVIEILTQYELGNTDIVESKIKNVRNYFKDIFHRPIYKRVENYLLLVKRLNDNPEIAATKSFRKTVGDTFEFVSMEEEDIQATSFFCWLKAKITRRKYYDVLISTVNFRKRQSGKKED